MFAFARGWALCCSVAVTAAAGASTLRFTVDGDATALVQDAERFSRFARQVAAKVDEALAAPADPSAQKPLLGLRVHLALHFREDDLALQLAGRIRASQTDPGERAHSGLTTRAIVASQRDPGRFEREFTRLLQELPRDPAIRLALQRARQKMAELSRDALFREVREQVAPRLARGEPCTLELADQLIRIGHRLRTILPLRDALLRAYDRALAAQD